MYLKIVRGLILFFILLISSTGFAQTDENQQLLNQASLRVYTYPDEVIKTTTFLLSKPISKEIESEANLLLAKAYFTKGEYESALKNAFQTRDVSVSEKSETYIQSLFLISEILNFFKLKDEAFQIIQNEPNTESGKLYFQFFNTINQDNSTKIHRLISFKNSINSDKNYNELYLLSLLELSRTYRELKNYDSAVYFAGEAERFSTLKKSGFYWTSKSLLAKGKANFLNKKPDEAKESLEKALEKVSTIGNPFLESEIHKELSTNSLAIKDNEGFYFHNQKSIALDTKTEIIENKTVNSAFQLITAEQDLKFNEYNKKQNYILIFLLGIFLVLVFLKIFSGIRYKNKVKTYSMFLHYLEREQEKEKSPEVVSTPENRSFTILKESEENILNALDKFESSKKFTHKDMSLSVLAAQLNTNTKYLSEIINRHKEKNFNTYINELKINYITDKIRTEPNYLNYKISYLAEEAGFSSHSTFTTVFKSVVGISPIAFIEFVRNQKVNLEV